MKRINVLAPNIANKIAAGEVVERPASVVKELIENSIDAGSTAITVEIMNGGISYIRITDNGSGIDENDVETAFLRHATSKLSAADDLSHIETLGFRGEALASIAAVSKVKMRTRTQAAEYGTMICIEGGVVTAKEPSGCPCGTTIEVSELFFNVPARLKFLKSPRSEAALIGDYVMRLILSNPSVSIRFINNGKTIYQSAGDGSLENAVFCVYGTEVTANLFPVNYDDGYLKLTGYVGSESLARNSRSQQSLFVNHRYIKSATVSYSVQRAFDTRLMHGKFPFFILDMLVSSYEIDVNVHPNKLEIRFKDDQRIGNSVLRAVNAAIDYLPFDNASGAEPVLKSEAPKPEKLYNLFENKHDGDNKSVELSRESAFNSGDKSTYVVYSNDKDTNVPFIPDNTDSVSRVVLHDRGNSSMPAFNFPSVQEVSDSGSIPVFSANNDKKRSPEISKPEQILLCDSPYTVIGAAFDTYIIVQQQDILFLIDQHAAHERMLYEKLIKDELRFDSQILLVPERITLDPVQYEILCENLERFTELGFSVQPLNGTMIRIDAVPSMVSSNAAGFISDAVSVIADAGSVSELDLVRSKLIQIACKKALKAGDRLEKEEIYEIIEAYKNGATPMTCPHGRPVIISITKTDLQKRFKRIV
ncbi:MAG: DNA mismatch repair endonuclease MutL [Clostridiales bacterium]|nr:DNA mismatch repair endonuclease MutL [Clostridiales bacterium]